MDVKSLDRRAQTPDDLAGPEGVAQNRYPAVPRLTNRTKRIAGVGLLVGVQSTVRKVAFEHGIGGFRGGFQAEGPGFPLLRLGGVAPTFWGGGGENHPPLCR